MSADHPRHFGSCALGAQRATRTDCLVGSVFPDPLAADVTPPAQPLTCRTDIGIAGRLILKTLRTENTFPFAAFCVSTGPRSEEHTSEIQSRPHIVCRPL